MENIISLENASVSYRKNEALCNISLHIEKGSFTGIIGPNGGGKTTLLKTVLGFLKPEHGNISISVSRDKIGYVPQTASLERDFPISVTEAVLTAFLKSGLHPFRRFTFDEKQKASKLLELVGLSLKADSAVSRLSGGEFQRMLIARALAAKPQIMLLDEPTANIDPESSEKIFKLLTELNRSGMTVITVTHDIPAVLKSADRLIYVNKLILFNGSPEEYTEKFK